MLFVCVCVVQDFKSFLDVVLALENRNTEASMRVGVVLPGFRRPIAH